MRIAFFDHPYHRITRSSQFFVTLLHAIGEVQSFYVEDNGTLAAGPSFDETQFDLIFIWQVHQAFRILKGRNTNIVFVPMYDAMQSNGQFYWKKEFGAARVLSFSRKLQEEVTSRGAISHYAQYFPDPSHYHPIRDYSAIRGFFWFRREPVDLRLLLDLIGNTAIERLTVHNAPDPGMKPQRIPSAPANIRAFGVTDWQSDAERYRALLREHNVFFAPRILEGIGMSFLEAMALGLCVVAPHASTMNEYIANGTNGILYPLGYRFPADFSRFAEQGKRARESVERGHRRWTAQREGLLDFIASRQPPRVSTTPRTSAVAKRPVTVPKVWVVTVCANAGAHLEPTIENVLSQDYPDFEYLILDGDSEDGSAVIIERYADRLAYRRAQKDAGVYHAMNDAVQKCTGDFVLFMNAGDSFVSSDALTRLFANMPPDTNIVFGHHLYLTTDGKERYHPAADFETTWQRLKRGQLWHDWLSSIPGHQATAVRRGLLSHLGFDTQYRIAADHDVLFRARDGGAKFYNADELISLYRGGGMSAKNRDLCHTEWEKIAAKFAPPQDVARFYGALSRASRHAENSSAFGVGKSLLDSLTSLFSSSAKRARLFEQVIPQGPTISWPVYDSGILNRVEFSHAGLPSFLSSMQGLADAESWGRWTIGRKAEFRFREKLPPRFQLVIECFGSSENLQCYAIVRAGGGEARLRIGPLPAQKHRLVIEQTEPSDVLTIEIPHPAAPAQLWPGKSDDTRELGIGLVSMKVIPAANIAAAFDTGSATLLIQEEIADDLKKLARAHESLDEKVEAQNRQLTLMQNELRRTRDIAMSAILQDSQGTAPKLNEEQSIAGWIAIGKKNYSFGRTNDAMRAFEDAAALAGNHPKSAVALVRAIADLGMKDMAQKLVVDFIGKPARFAAASTFLGIMHDDSNEGAKQFLSHLQDLGLPDDLNHLLQAQVSAQFGDVAQAWNEVDCTVKANPTLLDAHRYAIGLEQARLSGDTSPRLERMQEVKFFSAAPFQIVLPKDHPLDDYQRQWQRYAAAVPQLVAALSEKYPELAVIDVGANVGDTAATIRAVSACPVLCIEGHPDFLPFLAHNISLLGPDIVIEPIFLASRSGTSDALSGSASDGTASLLAQKSSQRASQTFSLETLDAVLKRHPRFAHSKFLKVDADGYDFDILLGAASFLAQTKPVVFFEYDPSILNQPSSAVQAIGLLLELGHSRLLVFDNFGNPLAKITQDVSDRLAELTRYLETNRENGVAVYYFDICAVHDGDADIFDRLAERTGFSVNLHQANAEAASARGQGANCDVTR